LSEIETVGWSATDDDPTHSLDYALDGTDFLKFLKGSIQNQNKNKHCLG
jgi:hypothetical protein